MNAESGKITIAEPGGEPVEVTIAQVLQKHQAGLLPAETMYARGGQWKPISQIINARLARPPAASVATAEPAASDDMNPLSGLTLSHVWQIIGTLNCLGWLIAAIVMLFADRPFLAAAFLAYAVAGWLVASTIARGLEYLAKIAHHSTLAK